MYSAKGSGRNESCFFTPEMNARAFERLSMENALRHALERDRLSLEYQPQWLLPEGRIAGVEALLRWRDPDRGLVSPTRFVPVAEEGGLIHPMGEWVLREAFRQSAAWQKAGLPHCVTAVNISALQFRKPGFIDLLRAILAETGADPYSLELELTETTLMRPDEDAMMQLHALRSMGFGLALDDFGTGYSSLAYLKRLPITRLKIDRSFVQDLPGDAEDAAVATATLSIARDLGLEVVAEGVETVEQRNFLLARGCRVMQGFLFSKPLPSEAVTRLLAAR
ncbi:MAG: EAL domain-containing protein, partial [Zoogloea sp.]|nr:EAL domain-containing protein [Zoogloea sp.]